MCATSEPGTCFSRLPLAPPVVDGRRIFVLTTDGFGERPGPPHHLGHFAIVEFGFEGRRVVAEAECPEPTSPELLGRAGPESWTILCSSDSRLRDHVFGVVNAGSGVTWLAREPHTEAPICEGCISELKYVVRVVDRLVLVTERPGTKGYAPPRWNVRVIPESGGSLAVADEDELTPLCLLEDSGCPRLMTALVVVGDRLHIVLGDIDRALAADFTVTRDGNVTGRSVAGSLEAVAREPCVAEGSDSTVTVTSTAPAPIRVSLRFPGGFLPYGPHVFGPGKYCARTYVPVPPHDTEQRHPDWVRVAEGDGNALVVYTIPKEEHQPLSWNTFEPDPRDYPGSFHVRLSQR